MFARKGCFKCGNLGHLAESCESAEKLCFNCSLPGHESNACASPRVTTSKQCYGCGGIGHIQADCPTLRLQQQAQIGNAGQKCYNCGRFGHIARACNGGGAAVKPASSGFEPRAPAANRLAATYPVAASTIICYRCQGPNHMARDCLAPIGATATISASTPTGPAAGVARKTCYRCNLEGHFARDCPENEY